MMDTSLLIVTQLELVMINLLSASKLAVADEQKAALKKAAGVSGGKDECQVRLKG